MDQSEVIAYLFLNFVDKEKWMAQTARLRSLASTVEPINWSDDDIRASVAVVVVARALLDHGKR